MDQIIEFTNNNPLLVTATILMALAVIFFEIRQRSQGVTAINANQAVRLINQGAKVVDIREQDRYDTGHIVGAIRVGPDALAGDKRLKKQRPVILVCDNGANSSRCTDELRKAGFESAFSLQGGISAWQQENLPIVASGQG